MVGNTVEIGKYGEDLAAQYLMDQGFSITSRNYRSGHCEIDLIAENDTHILFVEVKARTCLDPAHPGPYGRPGRAVNYAKRKHTVNAALHYLHENPRKKQPRMDVIEIYLKPAKTTTPEMLKINWIKNAYGQNG